MSRFSVAPITCGAKPSSANASTLSETDPPFSLAEINDEYADLGSRFLARCCAMATVSNHLSRAMVRRDFRCRTSSEAGRRRHWSVEAGGGAPPGGGGGGGGG